MRLYLASCSFHTEAGRRQLQEAGSQNALLSFASSHARLAGERMAQAGGYTVRTCRKCGMQLFAAGLGNGDDNWAAARSGKIHNILCSFGHGTSRLTADHFSTRDRKDDMLLYIAGDWGGPLYEKMCDSAGETNLLLTNSSQSARATANYFVDRRFDYNLLIDSGAFTAWRRNKPIVLQDYIAYAKGMLAKTVCNIEFIGLDVIAGTFPERKAGVMPTDKQTEAACQDGFDNYLAMEEAGVKCIPTFHRDDPWVWLERIAERAERFCLAPRVDGSPRSVKMKWLNECFQRLGADAWKKHRIHGLGISSQIMMEAYPFYSVDSTGWLWAASNATYRYFDGQKIRCLRKQDNWMDHKKCTDKTHQMGTRYRTVGGSVADGTTGCYYYGAQAILADVHLQNHITELWASRGVSFDN